MSFLLPKLTSKREVDQAIKSTAEKVLVLRFGRDEDPVCLQLDDILSKTSSDLMFFFNGQHMKVDYGKHYITTTTTTTTPRRELLPASMAVTLAFSAQAILTSDPFH
nr:thioredoxin-like protein 4B isoform X4 [Oryctolagus cuniculus]